MSGGGGLARRATPTRVLAHMVRSALGVKALRKRTMILSVLALVVGLPLLGSVVENLVAGTLGAAGKLLAVSVGLVGVAWALLRSDVRREAERQRRLRDQPAQARQALVISCSVPPPSPAQLALLQQGDHQAALRAIGAQGPRWVELLARALEFHAPRVERVILLVDQEQFRGEAGPVLERAVLAWLRGAPGRPPGQAVAVERAILADANDAERVRALALRCLHELRGLDVAMDQVAVCISGGTSAISVGMALAAAVLGAEVQYFPQYRDPHPGLPGTGNLSEVFGLLPVRIPTEAARLDFEEIAVEQV